MKNTFIIKVAQKSDIENFTTWYVKIQDRKIKSFNSHCYREGGYYDVIDPIEELANIYNIICVPDKDYLLESLDKYTDITSKEIKLKAASIIEEYKIRQISNLKKQIKSLEEEILKLQK